MIIRLIRSGGEHSMCLSFITFYFNYGMYIKLHLNENRKIEDRIRPPKK